MSNVKCDALSLSGEQGLFEIEAISGKTPEQPGRQGSGLLVLALPGQCTAGIR